MKVSNLIFGSVAGMLLLSLSARAQSLFEIKFNGACRTTNDAGDIVTEKVNNDTLIQEAVTAAGLTNSSGLTVVYHVNGGDNGGEIGDTIEVVNANGALVGPYPIFGFFSFQTVTSADGTQSVRRVQDVYSLQELGQSSDEVGNAIITERVITNHKTGEPKKTIIAGSMLYVLLANSAPSKICTANFVTTKPFQVQPQ